MSEHFNDPKDFHGLLGHREGPETCNTYNMLRLTEQLFAAGPSAAYADYYERALYNHILASINPQHPGYVYFTPIRPAHYRVYSEVENSFWCCVGTGMETRKYEFIYARAADDQRVNLFIASELTAPELGLALRQETAFPDEGDAAAHAEARRAADFHPARARAGLGGAGGVLDQDQRRRSRWTRSRPPYRAAAPRMKTATASSSPCRCAPRWSNCLTARRGTRSSAARSSSRHPDTWDMTGLRADGSRMAHVASGPVLPLDQAPSLLADAATIPSKVVAADPAAGPLHFRLVGIVEPAAPQGVPLVPSSGWNDSRYQMYWETTTRESPPRRQGAARRRRARIGRPRSRHARPRLARRAAAGGRTRLPRRGDRERVSTTAATGATAR